MTNPFALLGLPESLLLEPALVEESWRRRWRESESPDERAASEAASDAAAETTADAAAEAEANAARAALIDPVSRLQSWLALLDPAGEVERGLAPSLMDLFAQISPVLASTDALLARHAQVSTALARAVLAKEAVASQLAVQDRLRGIKAAQDALLTRFPEFETAAAVGDYTEARRALGSLKFLKRWEEQCRERLLALLSI